MSYVLFCRNEQGRPQKLKRYETRKGALIGMRASNKNAGFARHCVCETDGMVMEWTTGPAVTADWAPYVVMEETAFDSKFPVGVITVKNLMTGANVEIAEDTPWCCRPDSESYWST